MRGRKRQSAPIREAKGTPGKRSQIDGKNTKPPAPRGRHQAVGPGGAAEYWKVRRELREKDYTYETEKVGSGKMLLFNPLFMVQA